MKTATATVTTATAIPTTAILTTADIRRPCPEPNLIYHLPNKIEALPASGWHPVGVAVQGVRVVQLPRNSRTIHSPRRRPGRR